MAHDSNGHIYADSTSGVRVAQDIVAVVGGYNPTDGKSHPFTLGNINKWAKNKPFRADIRGRAATTQERINANFGLDFSVSVPQVGNDVVSAVKNAAQNTNCYAYDLSANRTQGKPRGGQYLEWHRVLDFEHYLHSAQAPMQPLANTTINRFLWSGSTNIQIEVLKSDIDSDSQTEISMASVIAGVLASTGIDISKWYIIIAVEYSLTNRFYGVSQETLDQSSRIFHIDLDKAQLVNGKPKFYIAAISDSSAGPYSKVVGLPFLRVEEGFGFGDLTVETHIPFTFDWQRVLTTGTGTQPPASWENMDTAQYRASTYQYHDDSGDPDVFLQLSSDCDMCYGFKITNTDTMHSAPLRLTDIAIESGLSVGVSGWQSGRYDQYPTGRIHPGNAWYATTKSGGWTAFPSSGVYNVAAGGVVYVFFGINRFQSRNNGTFSTPIRGQSTRGAQLSVYIDGVSVGELAREETWERPGRINIKY